MARQQLLRVATWLLDTFGCSPNNDAILGDIIEQYLAGRSGFWFWRQVFMALAAGLYDQAATNRRLTLRSVAYGTVSALILSTFLLRLVVFHHVIPPSAPILGPYFVLVLAALGASVHLGKFVASIHRTRGKAFALLYAGSFSTVLYMCWLIILFRFPEARLTSHIIAGGFISHIWILTALSAIRIERLDAQGG